MISIVVPCFNEETRVTGTLETIREAMAEFDYSYEVIVIDDGSTDYTVRVVQEFIESNPGMHVILHQNPHNLGLSRTYLFALPLTFTLPFWFGEPGIWYAGIVAEFLVLVLTAAVLMHRRRATGYPWGLMESRI